MKRGKNDAADAAAICEAVTRPTMRFVSVKSTEQQGVLMLHRTRELLVRQRTMLINAIRAHMAEFGIVAPVGVPQVKKLLSIIADTDDTRLPPVGRTCLEGLARQLLSLHEEIHAGEKRIHAWHRANEDSRRLETTRGIGPLTASALTTSAPPVHQPDFPAACHFSALMTLNAARINSITKKQRWVPDRAASKSGSQNRYINILSTPTR